MEGGGGLAWCAERQGGMHVWHMGREAANTGLGAAEPGGWQLRCAVAQVRDKGGRGGKSRTGIG
jgi:hypothetical protein